MLTVLERRCSYLCHWLRHTTSTNQWYRPTVVRTWADQTQHRRSVVNDVQRVYNRPCSKHCRCIWLAFRKFHFKIHRVTAILLPLTTKPSRTVRIHADLVIAFFALDDPMTFTFDHLIPNRLTSSTDFYLFFITFINRHPWLQGILPRSRSFMWSFKSQSNYGFRADMQSFSVKNFNCFEVAALSSHTPRQWCHVTSALYLLHMPVLGPISAKTQPTSSGVHSINSCSARGMTSSILDTSIDLVADWFTH